MKGEITKLKKKIKHKDSDSDGVQKFALRAKP